MSSAPEQCTLRLVSRGGCYRWGVTFAGVVLGGITPARVGGPVLRLVRRHA